MPGCKSKKDMLMLLHGNLSGDFKLKLLLTYHYENPWVFKKNNVLKSKLNVTCRANSKAWVTRQFFYWVDLWSVCPRVKKYLWEKQSPLLVPLLMDNAPAYPPGLEARLVEVYSFITLSFFPPNKIPLFTPIDQLVISNFKKLYTKVVSWRCFW